MKVERRQHARFDDFGRVSCEALCPVNGILDDVGTDGCKVHFDAPVTLSFEQDYELCVRFSRYPAEELVLICHPEWMHDDDGTTKIGFSFLRSPDTARLESYVAQLSAEQKEIDGDGIVPQEEDSCLFV